MQRVHDPAPTQSIEDRLPEYRGLVRQIAAQVASGIPRHVELDELVSAGTVGLVEAARRFDPDRGVRFEAFVAERGGSIIDFLRSVDWAPRSVRSAAKRIDEATSRLTCELGRTPSDRELAADLEMSESDLRSVQSSLVKSVVLALDRGASDTEDDAESIVASLADFDTPLPEDVLEQRELSGYLADAVNCLPDQARTVIALYYVDGMHMARIGELLGVTQSRASQIHSAALDLLHGAILAQLDPDRVEAPRNQRGRRSGSRSSTTTSPRRPTTGNASVAGTASSSTSRTCSPAPTPAVPTTPAVPSVTAGSSSWPNRTSSPLGEDRLEPSPRRLPEAQAPAASPENCRRPGHPPVSARQAAGEPGPRWRISLRAYQFALFA